jgi:hypothetical protein
VPRRPSAAADANLFMNRVLLTAFYLREHNTAHLQDSHDGRACGFGPPRVAQALIRVRPGRAASQPPRATLQVGRFSTAAYRAPEMVDVHHYKRLDAKVDSWVRHARTQARTQARARTYAHAREHAETCPRARRFTSKGLCMSLGSGVCRRCSLRGVAAVRMGCTRVSGWSRGCRYGRHQRNVEGRSARRSGACCT